MHVDVCVCLRHWSASASHCIKRRDSCSSITASVDFHLQAGGGAGRLASWAQARAPHSALPPPGRFVVCHTASASWPLWYWHKLVDWRSGSLTFPSAPSSTPSRPMTSFKLTAPVDCLPPSNFKSLGRKSQRKKCCCLHPKET